MSQKASPPTTTRQGSSRRFRTSRPDAARDRHRLTAQIIEMDIDVDEELLRELAPVVLSVLVRRGADFATAEDAVQEALLKALTAWTDEPPRDPKGWLITTAWHAFVDLKRSDGARRAREERAEAEPPPGPPEGFDDTLQLYVLCAHSSRTPSSAVALTLRAVGGLTTRQIAEAYLVPEATMAQRISRAKRTVSGVRFDEPSDLGTVMHTLYLVFPTRATPATSTWLPRQSG